MIYLTFLKCSKTYTINESRLMIKTLGGVFMATEVKKQDVHNEDHNSLKGALFSSIVFVGGGMLFFIVVLFYFYMTRL